MMTQLSLSTITLQLFFDYESDFEGIILPLVVYTYIFGGQRWPRLDVSCFLVCLLCFPNRLYVIPLKAKA